MFGIILSLCLRLLPLESEVVVESRSGLLIGTWDSRPAIGVLTDEGSFSLRVEGVPQETPFGILYHTQVLVGQENYGYVLQPHTSPIPVEIIECPSKTLD